MTKIGEGEFCDHNDAFARVYNNLLLHEYIYYFTPVHFNLLFAYFSIFVTECLTSDIFSMLLCGVSDCIYCI